MKAILGISAFYHDSAAALVVAGKVVAAAQEERFSRRKNDESFPVQAIAFCLKWAAISPQELSAVVFYEKPIQKFTRTLETFLSIAPRGLRSFLNVLPNWLGERLNMRKTIREFLPELSPQCKILFLEHHQSHAASAFLASPFESSAILTVDGVGEWATSTIGKGEGKHFQLLKEIRFPHSVGLLYSAFTAYCGFRVNSGEYKLMGLAPYGTPRFEKAIREQLVDIRADGSIRLNLDYFDFLASRRMTHPRLHKLLGAEPRKPDSNIEDFYADVAASIQKVTEDILLRMARHAREVTLSPNLCMAGGVALNCVANGRILREAGFENFWIQPAAGDAGAALGAALAGWYELEPEAERKPAGQDAMSGALLGPEFSESEIAQTLSEHKAVYEKLDDTALFTRVTELLDAGNVIGWLQGRMEFGPRALGNRSILGDARSPKMQSLLNLKIKFRESFRPFAPIVLHEKVSDHFQMSQESPYMLLVCQVKKASPPQRMALSHSPLLRNHSPLPAVTHVDGSARVQTVNQTTHPRLHRLLSEFEWRTGCPVLINTSFNVRGEPVVCTPDDAYRCFINTQMDYLVLGNYLLKRTGQPHSRLTPTFQPQPD